MIVPSIDLMSGKAVQLRQGKMKIIERDNPLQLAEEFGKLAETAVIDLDAAFGTGDNSDIIKKICRMTECRVGGGIRSIEKAKEILGYGAVKIILGSRVFANDSVDHTFLGRLNKEIDNNRILVALDCFDGEIVTEGWKHKTGLSVISCLEELDDYVYGFLCTCVEKEGCMQGTDIEFFREISQRTKKKVTAAGGISSLDEIRQLTELGIDVQLGMAIYSDKISLIDAFIESINWKTELIPSVTVDKKGRVLMLAYSSRDSLKNMYETGNMWYFSRSRKKLWMKGENSGNIQEVIKIRSDCDDDTLLVMVNQKGFACHLGTYSCFGEIKSGRIE